MKRRLRSRLRSRLKGVRPKYSEFRIPTFSLTPFTRETAFLKKDNVMAKTPETPTKVTGLRR